MVERREPGDDQVHELPLTRGEQQLLLSELLLPATLESKLAVGLVDGDGVVARLTTDDLDELLGHIAFAANHARDANTQGQLDMLYPRVEALLARAAITETSSADASEAAAPILVLSLSPRQQQRLMEEWDGENAAVQLNAGLSLPDVEGARFLANARTFLRTVAEAGTVKATAKGNLNRAFVDDMLDALQYADGVLELTYSLSKVLNEEDVWPLHVLRLNLELAGLLKRRKGRFSATKKGLNMLAEARTGELYELLFRTFFRRFNLAYLDGHPAGGDFQYTVGFTLCLLGAAPDVWQDPEQLSEVLIHPLVMDDLQRLPRWSDADVLVRMRLLKPLEEFGLLERQVVGKRGYREVDRFRRTALFDRFLSFEPGPEDGPQPFMHTRLTGGVH